MRCASMPASYSWTAKRSRAITRPGDPALFAPNYGSTVFCALTRASAPFMHAPPPGFVTDPLLHARGALTIAREDQRGQLEATIAHIHACGSHADVLDEAAARAMVPALREGYVKAAAFEPDVQDIDVDALLRAFLKRARTRGLHTQFSARIEAPRRQGRTWQIAAGAQTIESRVLINCAGAWADEFRRTLWRTARGPAADAAHRGTHRCTA